MKFDNLKENVRDTTGITEKIFIFLKEKQTKQCAACILTYFYEWDKITVARSLKIRKGTVGNYERIVLEEIHAKIMTPGIYKE